MKKGENMDNLETMRHSLSHVLAAAVKKLYPDAKFGIGPAIDSGFYYDIDFGTTKVTDRDLAKVEKEMRKIIAKNPSIKKRMVPEVPASTGDEALFQCTKPSGVPRGPSHLQFP